LHRATKFVNRATQAIGGAHGLPMFAALLRSATSRSTAVAAAALRLATRGMVGHTIAKKPHVGWPRLSRDGWPFARWLKKKGDFETKQAKARRTGMNKGALALPYAHSRVYRAALSDPRRASMRFYPCARP
jgi:hypothetical protein